MLADDTTQFAGLGIGIALIFCFTKSGICVPSTQKFHFLSHHKSETLKSESIMCITSISDPNISYCRSGNSFSKLECWRYLCCSIDVHGFLPSFMICQVNLPKRATLCQSCLSNTQSAILSWWGHNIPIHQMNSPTWSMSVSYEISHHFINSQANRMWKPNLLHKVSRDCRQNQFC